MSTLIKHKQVEFTELFYDLVFVYAISKTTALIRHLHYGVVSWESLSAFLVTILILVNTWMIQTVFTNRYGRNSMFNVIIMFAKMAMLLLISNTIIDEWQRHFNYFCWMMGTSSLILFLQYLVQYYKKDSGQEDKALIKGFLLITGVRTALTYMAALFPVTIGYTIFLIGIVWCFLMPLTFRQRQKQVPIHFPHLIERISLLVIITFGEMIMGIANFFTPETLHFNSVFYFLIVVLLFLYYFGEFDYAIDEQGNSQGLSFIYSHYPIFIGLIMVTVSMSFLAEREANDLFVVGFLYAGLAFFQGAVLSNSKYNKYYVKFDKIYIAIQTVFFITGLITSLIFAADSDLVLYITTAMLFAIESHFLFFYIKRSKAHGKMDIEWM